MKSGYALLQQPRIWLVVVLMSCGYFVGAHFFQKDSLEQTKESLEPITTLTGKLCLKCFRGPPEYSSAGEVETKDYCWVVELEESSLKSRRKGQPISCPHSPPSYRTFNVSRPDSLCRRLQSKVLNASLHLHPKPGVRPAFLFYV